MTLLVQNFVKEKKFSNTKELMVTKSLTFEITSQICNSLNFFENLPILNTPTGFKNT